MSEPQTRFVVGPRDGGKRLDRFLQRRIPGLSRARIQQAIRDRVSVSWSPAARPATPVQPGGVVQVGWVPLEEPPLALDFAVLARGAGWLAIDKPPTLPVHPVNKIRENTVIRMLRRQEDDPDLRLVHRLDRETSGALLIARDSETASRLSQAFARGEVSKEYLAVVRGVPAEPAGEIDLAIGKATDSAVFTRQAVVQDGQAARTRWRVERSGADRALLRLFPRQGRRHQLRVHLEAIGHPILGDILYGRPDDDYLAMVADSADPRAKASGPKRQLLHCARLCFPDPAGRGKLEVVAPLPADFQTFGPPT